MFDVTAGVSARSAWPSVNTNGEALTSMAQKGSLDRKDWFALLGMTGSLASVLAC